MLQLTMDLETTAEVLGIDSEAFRELVEREHLEGVLRLKNGWRVSIFTLAEMLNTTPDTLLDFIEDDALGRLMEEGADDDRFEGEEGWRLYQEYVTEAGP